MNPEKLNKRMTYPRWWAWLKAHFSIPMYFWSPCPVCGENFAGFEDGAYGLTDSWSGGRMVCCKPSCQQTAEAQTKAFYKSGYIQTVPAGAYHWVQRDPVPTIPVKDKTP